VQWLPFFLNDNTPEGGEDMMEHLSKKYGPAAVARFSGPNNPLAVAGAKVGVHFNNARRVIPTKRCHQLMELCNAVAPDKANALMELMFKQYFEQAVDVSKPDVLVALAAEVGLDTVQARAAVDDASPLREQVARHVDTTRRQLRVSGVPFVVIERLSGGGAPITFSGAQPPEVVAECLEEAAET